MFLRKSILLIVLMGLGLSLALAACASSPAAVTPSPVAGSAVPATVTSTFLQATVPPATATPASTPAPAATAPALPTGQPEEAASAAAIATHAQAMQAEFQRIADLARQAQALLPADEGQQPTVSPTPTQSYGRLGGRAGLAAPRRPAASVRERLAQIIAWAEQGKEEAGQLAEVAQGLQDAGSAAKAKPLFARGEKMIERLGALAQQIDQAIQQMLSERPSGSEQVAALMAQARNADARILASVQVTRHALEALQRSGGNQNKATPTTP